MPKNTFDIIDGRVARLTKGLDRVEDQLYKELEKLILTLDSKGGKFAKDKTAFKVLSQLKPKLADIVAQSDYRKNILAFVDSFDEINANLKDLHKNINQITIPEKLLATEKAGFVRDTLNTLQDAQINSAFTEPIRKALFQRVNLGAGVKDTLDVMKDLVRGTEERKGILTRWSGQVARDALGQYQGNVNTRIQQEYDFAGYLYVGSLVDDSRSQCERWVNKGFIPMKELKKELAWAMRNGSGMVKSTTADTFAVYRGGYNCRHEAIPSDGPVDKEIKNARSTTVLANDKGNVLRIDPDHGKNELAGNKRIGLFLRDQGYDVDLLPLQKEPGVKNPDALVNGTKFEFKSPNRSSVNAVDQNIKLGQKQANNLVIEIPEGFQFSIENIKIISRRIERSRKLKSIWIIKGGKLKKFTRKDISNRNALLKNTTGLT